MNTATIISVIGIIISAISVIAVIYFNSKSSQKTDVKEIEERVKENTKINMKLDDIASTMREVKDEVSSIKEELQKHNDRIIKVEESAKQGHKRLDGFEKRLISLEQIMSGGNKE